MAENNKIISDVKVDLTEITKYKPDAILNSGNPITSFANGEFWSALFKCYITNLNTSEDVRNQQIYKLILQNEKILIKEIISPKAFKKSFDDFKKNAKSIFAGYKQDLEKALKDFEKIIFQTVDQVIKDKITKSVNDALLNVKSKVTTKIAKESKKDNSDKDNQNTEEKDLVSKDNDNESDVKDKSFQVLNAITKVLKPNCLKKSINEINKVNNLIAKKQRLVKNIFNKQTQPRILLQIFKRNKDNVLKSKVKNKGSNNTDNKLKEMPQIQNALDSSAGPMLKIFKRVKQFIGKYTWIITVLNTVGLILKAIFLMSPFGIFHVLKFTANVFTKVTKKLFPSFSLSTLIAGFIATKPGAWLLGFTAGLIYKGIKKVKKVFVTVKELISRAKNGAGKFKGKGDLKGFSKIVKEIDNVHMTFSRIKDMLDKDKDYQDKEVENAMNTNPKGVGDIILGAVLSALWFLPKLGLNLGKAFLGATLGNLPGLGFLKRPWGRGRFRSIAGRYFKDKEYEIEKEKVFSQYREMYQLAGAKNTITTALASKNPKKISNLSSTDKKALDLSFAAHANSSGNELRSTFNIDDILKLMKQGSKAAKRSNRNYNTISSTLQRAKMYRETLQSMNLSDEESAKYYEAEYGENSFNLGNARRLLESMHYDFASMLQNVSHNSSFFSHLADIQKTVLEQTGNAINHGSIEDVEAAANMLNSSSFIVLDKNKLSNNYFLRQIMEAFGTRLDFVNLDHAFEIWKGNLTDRIAQSVKTIGLNLSNNKNLLKILDKAEIAHDDYFKTVIEVLKEITAYIFQGMTDNDIFISSINSMIDKNVTKSANALWLDHFKDYSNIITDLEMFNKILEIFTNISLNLFYPNKLLSLFNELSLVFKGTKFFSVVNSQLAKVMSHLFEKIKTIKNYEKVMSAEDINFLSHTDEAAYETSLHNMAVLPDLNKKLNANFNSINDLLEKAMQETDINNLDKTTAALAEMNKTLKAGWLDEIIKQLKEKRKTLVEKSQSSDGTVVVAGESEEEHEPPNAALAESRAHDQTEGKAVKSNN